MSAAPSTLTPRVTFWGAARTVTGSMHLVEAGPTKILFDCGLYQGRRSEARARNAEFPFRPIEIDAVVLSHAHIDHCGNLPNLVRQGFAGPIYCTPATRDLAAVMLADAAKIHEEDAAYLNRHRPSHDLIVPLYTRRDAQQTVKFCLAVPYDRPHDIARNMQIRFVEAGHLLGSAMVAAKIDGPGGERTLTFTGDLGRKNLPILRDPAPVPPADLLISESTYGGRTHPPVELLADELAGVVKRTADRGGKLLIPAFSLGRTQTVVYFLHQLIRARKLPALPIFVDSPLAADATEVFRLHPDCFDYQTVVMFESNPDLFGQKRIKYARKVEDSKALNDRPDPCIIIAASGMCENGRIVHHLKHHIEDPRTTILMIGYQAPDTLGRRIIERRPFVRIHDHDHKLKAEVVIMNGFSSHADHPDFVEFLGPLAGTTKRVRLVHGEPPAAEALAMGLRGKGFQDVAVPGRGESVEV